MYENLIRHIQRFVSLNEEEQIILKSYLKFETVKKKQFLLEEGQVCHANWFIVKGCLRSYTLKENGNKQMVQFAIENWWLTDYFSFEQKKASNLFIQTVEDCELISIDDRIQDEVFAKIPQLERYFRLILQKSFAASLMRLQYMFNLSPEERFHHFNNNFPSFIQRVPQYMLASYLGFTPEFLSKIRAKIADS
ncbi:Crp/Fnr family transcriptional regulator [Dyadobacter subterraneus]|uniref:Crp/Fnr family transcriptional regulator n=1 Tax=Dyadobacter subterraneus TaxID=2773304 RepID=A0ABR9WFK3_9BACT|nr:Crp/Fnr family transcriptional regulator [Dyadobacter subterraneus]MBE9464273.1 Crp/Fnr family transcriptional regulator [Dyadobacter subterraneus]